LRFSIQLPTHRVDRPEALVSGPAIMEMARGAEAAGFDACNVTDHPFPGDAWLASGGHHALDPFVALSFAAAATERIRLHTFLLVLPYRNAFVTAKAIASLDALSRGRLIVGVATGYLEAEYEALGADFSARNEVTDQALAAMRAAWSGESVRFEGRGFRARANTMLPRPHQRPGPPIWIGGNSRRAIRRAAELADGWMPFPSPPAMARLTRTASIANEAELAQRIGWLAEAADAAGRNAPLDICMAPFGVSMHARRAPPPQQLVDGLGRLAELGVTWTHTILPCEDAAEFCDEASRYAQEVVAKLR